MNSLPTPSPSPRLTYRLMTAEDADFLLELMNQPEYLIGIGDRGIRTLDQARDYFRAKIEIQYHQNGFGMYLLTSKTEGVRIGFAGIIKRDSLLVPEVGYAISNRFFGQGYATEAAQHCVHFARDTLHLSVLGGIVNVTNAASARILEKCGLQFVEEKTLPEINERLRYYEIHFKK